MPSHDDPTELEPRPGQPAPPSGRSTTAQLRRDIESGATGDKAPALDPASAPLGTDDEAAGAVPSPELVAATRRTERDLRPMDRPGLSTDPRHGWRIAGGVAGLMALGLIALWISFA